MKRVAIMAVVVLLVVAGWATYQEASRQQVLPLADLMPQNAVLFLEAKDFGAMLREWNSSAERQVWVATDNYEVFSRSRLFLRLKQAQSEFAVAAGLPPDMSFLGDIAGGQSALGIYDIGKLEFLYITRIPADSAVKSGIWQQRAKFETREVEGRKFYVRTDPQSERVVAFAIEGDTMILGTREDLVAGALSLFGAKKSTALSQQGWFVDAAKAAKNSGELRLIVHLAEVTKTPQFRTYWVQQNITELRQYESSVSDLFRTSDSFREERSLLLKSGTDMAPSPDASQVAELMRLVPPETGFYRATATPSVEDSLALLLQKILTPTLGPTPASKLAPNVAMGDQLAGSASNLDVRIDSAPDEKSKQGGGPQGSDVLKDLLKAADIRAAFQLHNSEAAMDGVFVSLHSTIVLRSATDWDEKAVLQAVQRTVSPALTTSNLGVAWTKAGTAQGYFELDGLARVALAVRGKELFVSNDPAGLMHVLERIAQPVSVEPAIYYAGFDHRRERQNFVQFVSLIDRPSATSAVGFGDRAPQFFSQNVAGLSKTLASMKSETVVARRAGSVEYQTVRYEWAR